MNMEHMNKLHKEFEEFKKKNPGCYPSDEIAFWRDKAEALAFHCDWLFGKKGK